MRCGGKALMTPSVSLRGRVTREMPREEDILPGAVVRLVLEGET